MSDIVKYPFGPATTVALTAEGDQNLSIVNDFTIVDGVTVQATANRSLKLTVAAQVNAGARLFCKLKTNGTETTAFSTKMQGATLTGAAGKTKCVEFIYDGTNFVETGTPVQID